MIVIMEYFGQWFRLKGSEYSTMYTANLAMATISYTECISYRNDCIDGL